MARRQRGQRQTDPDDHEPGDHVSPEAERPDQPGHFLRQDENAAADDGVDADRHEPKAPEMTQWGHTDACGERLAHPEAVLRQVSHSHKGRSLSKV